MPLDAFTLFDYKGEGEINQAQFREIANALGVSSQLHHHIAETGGRGWWVTGRQFPCMPMVCMQLQLQADDEKFEELWKKADEDGSGMISYAEFKNIFVKLVKVDDEFKKR